MRTAPKPKTDHLAVVLGFKPPLVRPLEIVGISFTDPPQVNALNDISRAVSLLAELPPEHFCAGLALMGDGRPYTFERNSSRWPDGRWYLVDREYRRIGREHPISFTRDELTQLGFVSWGEVVTDILDIGYNEEKGVPLLLTQYSKRVHELLPCLSEMFKRASVYVSEAAGKEGTK